MEEPPGFQQAFGAGHSEATVMPHQDEFPLWRIYEGGEESSAEFDIAKNLERSVTSRRSFEGW